MDKPTLLGREWMKMLNIKIDDCVNVVLDKNVDFNVNFDNASSTVEYFKNKFPNCFNLNDTSGILGEPINIAMKQETIPIFCKSRPVPYALRNLVDKELDTLINSGVLHTVSHSKWATPIVAVPKLDGNGRETVRICGDFSVTVNKFCETQFYPLPSQEEILTSMGDGKYFSKIDLSKAFHQLQISPESQELLTLNTPRGLLRYSKLPFGIKSASFLFQQKMDEILKDFFYTNCYIDDLFIRANTKEECIKRTEIVMDRLNSYNVKINLSKCEFFKDCIQILGHRKDSSGVHPLDDKCNAIYQTSIPTNATELKSYLGLLGYYSHFIPNLSTTLRPLYDLLEKDVKWKFDKKCVKVFEYSKTLLKKHNVLVHFEMARPIVLQCDASDYGVGAVLCHEFPGGELRPIFFASKTLSRAERNYAQVHKEALAIIFGIKKFNKFLQGQKFTIETDSKPLLTLFGHNKSVPTMVNARMQRWAIILSNYDYIVKYKKGTELLLADALSRLPCKNDAPIDDFTHFICFFSDFETLKHDDIQRATSLDPCLSKVLNYTRFGWPTDIDENLKDFKRVKDELSVEGNCLLRANRLVIPEIWHDKILELLHNEHPGIFRIYLMKIILYGLVFYCIYHLFLLQPRDPKLRVLHISDVHIDLNYKENTSASCGEPLCCRPTSGPPKSPSDASGYWGDYRDCDIPLRTLENMLDHINKTHKIDYVIWTGDIPPHDIWNYTRDDVIHLLHTASKVMFKYFSHVPIFPALGNHESSPVNSFPIPQIKGNDSISWLYDEVEKAWLPWVPGNSETLKLGAFYTAEVYPGLRIISLNMNYCNSLNWWLLINSTDPTGQLAWLVAQLQMAENKGEKVHIIGHIPPGEPDCLGVWSSNYNRIINRYESTVTGQFFGHTHSDEFELFYDETSQNPRATNVVYIGPSVTTYDGFNPGYRIYTVDGNYPQSSRYVLDHETYFANLTEANLKMEMNWQFEYSAKDAYNMSSLFPEDWDNLTRKFQGDDSLFQKFHSYYYKMATFSTPDCDKVCKDKFICRMRRGQSNNPLVC
ncbi:Sphingomyelin phosphodiesterase [Araneus ventricosus]|uniref:RNA-directed DNA polymerase n=1 Tax=Araneus ventricosus TaxID=182803 RepID=A0A4Y2AGE1_ARAVE|nr:Sphingomyelin phosphodiesterase [Araneus ventricosus]